MVLEVMRWNYRALDVIRQPRGVTCDGRPCVDESVGVWLRRNGFSDIFRDSYLIVSIGDEQGWLHEGIGASERETGLPG